MAEWEMQDEPEMMSLNDALALMRVTAAAGGSAKIGPTLLARMVEQITKLEADVERLSPSDDEVRYTAEQDWSGLSGAEAWHLAYRHGEGWAGIGDMMEAWRDAEVKRVTANLVAESEAKIPAMQAAFEERLTLDKANRLLVAKNAELEAKNAELEAERDAAHQARRTGGCTMTPLDEIQRALEICAKRPDKLNFSALSVLISQAMTDAIADAQKRGAQKMREAIAHQAEINALYGVHGTTVSTIRAMPLPDDSRAHGERHDTATPGQRAAQLEAIAEFDAAKRGER